MGVAGTAVGTMALGKPLMNAIAEENNKTTAEPKEWMSSTCHMCPAQCGVSVRVLDGKVIKLDPNSASPAGFSNNAVDFVANHKLEGAVLCPKGNAAIAALYEPDRIKKPMKRTNPEKGIGVDPKWQEISWDEAYTTMTDKLGQLKTKNEAHKLLWFCDESMMADLQQDFCTLYGTPNFSTSSNIKNAGKKAVYKMMSGTASIHQDFLNSKYILLFGWNPFGSLNNGYLPRVITRAQENGAKLVVVDPYLTATVANSQQWLPIKPGTDGVLALALGHVIIEKGLQDNDFIAKHAIGFDRYKAYVKDKTPDWAEKLTGIPAKKIEALAIELATAKPVIVDFGSGVTQNTNGFYGAWAVSLLPALMGQVNKPGTVNFSTVVQASVPVSVVADSQAVESLKQPRFDGGNAKYPFMDKGSYVEIMNMLLDDKAVYKPKVAVVVGQNLLMDLPAPKNTAKALKTLEFLVVVDTMESETAQLADLLLPGSTFLEKYALTNHNVPWPSVALTQPVVEPFYEQPAEYEIIANLGDRLKLKDAKGSDFFSVGVTSKQPLKNKTKWYLEYLSVQLQNGAAKISLDELKNTHDGVWMNTSATPVNTLNKIAFTSQANAALKDSKGKLLKELPVYFARHEQPEASYPFCLVNWNEASHQGSATQNNIYLLNLKGDNPLQVNTKTAEKLGLKNHDVVRLTSEYGAVRAQVYVTEGIHPDVVGLQKGFGHWALGNLAKKKGTQDAFLRPALACHVSGQAINKECCVNITKV